MLTIGALFVFLVAHRFWHRNAGKRERWSVIYTNLVLLAIVVGMSSLIGFRAYLLVQVPILVIAFAVGVWLFYVQHNYEGVYWERQENWDFLAAALNGSSYYKLPRVLQWFTGNIGFHHIHHLRARIPNYNLQQCYDEMPSMQAVKPLTLRESLKSMWLDLWDEECQRLISFRELKSLSQAG